MPNNDRGGGQRGKPLLTTTSVNKLVNFFLHWDGKMEELYVQILNI